MKQAFRDNVVILTGASYGVGRQLAFDLAREGAWLVLASRSPGPLAEVASQCMRLGGRALVVPTDISDLSQCQNLIAAAVDEYGRIDTLINNAGIGTVAKFAEHEDLALFEKVFRVNFFGSVYCTHFALPYLRRTRGRLVGVSSLRGLYPSAIADAYGPSKHAMVGFFDSLRIELQGSGVSVTMIYPGWVKSGITSRALNADSTPLGAPSSHEVNAMSVDVCARIVRRAIASRKRQVVLTLQGKIGLWLKLVLPGLVDVIVSRDFDR